MFCEIPSSRHSSLVNLALNLGSLSLITRDGNPNQLNTCLRYSWAVPSAVISSLQGIKTDVLVSRFVLRQAISACDLEFLSVVTHNC